MILLTLMHFAGSSYYSRVAEKSISNLPIYAGGKIVARSFSTGASEAKSRIRRRTGVGREGKWKRSRMFSDGA